MIVPEYEPAFVEAAVLAAVGGRAEARAFDAERETLYEIADGEAREAAFAALHARWFARLGLEHPLALALGERPELEARCARCLVARAPAARAEGADLLVERGDVAPSAHLLVRLMPGTLADPERALELLRRELLHVADMLDPDFGYEPRLPSAESGDPLAAGRYRTLWDAYVDGRLVRAGRAPWTRRAERWREFQEAFPALGSESAIAFARFFDAERCTHGDLLAFVAGHETSVCVTATT